MGDPKIKEFILFGIHNLIFFITVVFGLVGVLAFVAIFLVVDLDELITLGGTLIFFAIVGAILSVISGFLVHKYLTFYQTLTNNKQANEIVNIFQSKQNSQPIVMAKVQCYHYRRSGNTSTKHVSYEAIEYFQYRTWRDLSDRDVSFKHTNKRLRIRMREIYEADNETRLAISTFTHRLKEENRGRDRYCSVTLSYILDNPYPKNFHIGGESSIWNKNVYFISYAFFFYCFL
jgi:hypothetical protein